MTGRHIPRPLGIWLTFPAAPSGTLSGVVSYSSPAEGVRFHSYAELMRLLHRLAETGGGQTSTPTLRLAS